MSARATMVRKQRSADRQIARPLKIVITGPFSAGKTTFIQTISEVAIVGTERDVTDETKSVKNRTTVAMDFGRMSFGDDLSLFLFGTPGQRRFEVMWEILSEGMIGFILLVHAGDDRSLEESAHILETFREYADVPYVIGVTHLDQSSEGEKKVLARVMKELDLPDDVKLVSCDPREREDVKGLLLEILFGVMARLEKAAAHGGGR